MKTDWLKQRLTAAKQASPMWAELAEAIQEVFEGQIEPLLDRLKGLTSAYTMDSDDLLQRINELGEFFILSDRVDKADWPLALMQRHDEIHMKKTDYPLLNTISREFSGMKATWEPLYAPKDQVNYPYGSRFVIKSQLEYETIPAKDWFMTSRGVIRLPITSLHNFGDALSIDERAAAFEEVMTRFIEPLIPLHIVFEGPQYYMIYTVRELEEIFRLLLAECGQTFPPALESNMLKRPEELATAPDGITQTMPVMNNGVAYAYSYRARMDASPLDAWTLDRQFPGAP